MNKFLTSKIVITVVVLAFLLLIGVAIQNIIGRPKNDASNKMSQSKPCTLEAQICPDGSSVGRTGPNCEFAPCGGVKAPIDFPVLEKVTTNWKTYSGKVFTIKYPETYTYIEKKGTTDSDYIDTDVVEFTDNESIIVITFSKNYNNVILQQALSKGPGTRYVDSFLEKKTIYDIEIHGEKGKMVQDLSVGPGGIAEEVAFLKNNRIYQLELENLGSDTTIFNQMLSTLRL